MAADGLSLTDVIARASGRAIPSNKAVKLLREWLGRRDYSEEVSENDVSAALLHHLLQPYSSTLINQYLVQSLNSHLVTARTVFIHLLFYLNNSNDNTIPTQSIENISHILIDHFSATPQDPFPSTLSHPQTSLPGPSTPPPPISTLHLLQPLLQQCTTTKTTNPTPLHTLLSLILSLIPPYPAPPLDVGLQSGSLLQLLPDSLSIPLRNCLSGLMADVTDSQNVQAGLGGVEMPNMAGLGVGDEGREEVDMGEPFRGISLAQSVGILLASARRMERHSVVKSLLDTPPQSHIDLIHFGPRLTRDPALLLGQLFQSSILDYLGSYTVVTKESTWNYLFIVESVPRLLKWWKDNAVEYYPYPESLVPILTGVFEFMDVGLSAHYTWVLECYSTMIAQADANDDMGGVYTQPDGWTMSSIQVGLVLGLLQLGLIDQGEVSGILPGVVLPSILPGESLINRISNASKTHSRPLSHVIVHAPGAARSLAEDVFNVVKQCPQLQPPEGLFTNLSSEPDLLSCLTAVMTSSEILDVLVKHLLEPEDDQGMRSDDPQGSLTRFGEGVVLVEAYISHYQLPLPDLLLESRTALSLSDLGTKRKGWLNGWIKALFGPDGIDDQILLATPPQEFCRLAPCLIQQAIWATGCGQIDQEVLHSGLSYFAQPLLGWSLGGIISWLCDETERKGSLSALHLDVLQNLVLESTIPSSLMYVVRPGILRLLGGNTGLEEVIQSSRFDALEVKGKLDGVEYRSTPILQSSVDSLVILCQQLAIARQLDASQAMISGALMEAVDDAIVIQGRFKVVDLIVREMLQPSLGSSDPLVAIAVILFTIKRDDNRPLSVVLIDKILPMVFEPSSRPVIDPKQVYATYTIGSLCRLIKYTILCTWDIHPGMAKELGEHLFDGLTCQMGRPLSVGVGGKRKKGEIGKGLGEFGAGERSTLEAVVRALAGDEELRDKIPRVGDLLDSL